MSTPVSASKAQTESRDATSMMPRGVRTAESARMAKASKLGIPTGNVRIQLSQLKRLKTSTESLRLLIWSAGTGRDFNVSITPVTSEEYNFPALTRVPSHRKTSKRIGGMISATCVETISNPERSEAIMPGGGGNFSNFSAFIIA